MTIILAYPAYHTCTHMYVYNVTRYQSIEEFKHPAMRYTHSAFKKVRKLSILAPSLLMIFNSLIHKNPYIHAQCITLHVKLSSHCLNIKHHKKLYLRHIQISIKHKGQTLLN